MNLMNEINQIISSLKIELINDYELIPYENNARTHSDEQIEKIADSIKLYGMNNPITINDKNIIIAGHGRFEALKLLGITKIPTIRLSHLQDEAKRRGYTLADNRIALDARWDEDLLFKEFEDLKSLDFDILDTGFNQSEIDAILHPHTEEGLTEPDHIPEEQKEIISVYGDIWRLGNHRLMCGDSISITDVEKLLNNNKINMVYTDPPYGISIVSSNKIGGDKYFGSVGGGKIVKSNSYAKIIGDETTQTAIDSYNLCVSLNIPLMIFWGGNYYANALPPSSCWIVWDKDNTGNFADAELAWTNNKTAVRIFKHTWNGLIKESERGEKRVHPTQKPVALAIWCFEKYGEESKNILDLFGGSGSTLIACEKTSRNCFMMEISPNYIDVIIRRWQEFTGKSAVLEGEEKTFDEMKDNRKSLNS